MPLKRPSPPDGHPNAIPIQLFPTLGRGYGFARSGHIDGPPEGYDRTLNMDVRHGTISPSIGVADKVSVANTLGGTSTWSLVIRDTTLVPDRQNPHWSVGQKVYSYADGTITTENTAPSTGVVGGAAIHDDGSGIQLYTGSIGTSVYMSRRDAAGAWTDDGDVKGFYCTSAGGAFWRSVNRNISKCAAGSDPFTIGNWGSDIPCGPAGPLVRGLLSIGGAPVVLREDGLWTYNETSNRFENQYPLPFHEENFRFIAPDGEGGWYTCTGFGELLRIHRYGAVRAINLLEGKRPGKDTPAGNITSVATQGKTVYAAMEPGYKWTTGAGLTVKKTVNNGSAYTNYTTEATDDDATTVVNLNALDTLANGDWLVIGADEPFVAARFEIVATNANASALTVEHSIAGGWNSGDTWWDNTIGKTAARTFGKASTGNNPAEYSSIWMTAYSAASGGWAKTTIDGSSKYWIRLSVSAALSATVSIGKVTILCWRPAADFTQTNNDQAEQWEASASYPKIFVGTDKDGTGQLVWDDVWTVPLPGQRIVLSLAEVRMQGADIGLVAAAPSGVVVYPIPRLSVPQSMIYPQLSRDSTHNLSPVFYPSAWGTGDRYWRLVAVDVQSRNVVAGTDTIQVAAAADDNAWTLSASLSDALLRFSFDNTRIEGTYLKTAIRVADGATTDQWGPEIDRVTMWVEELDVPFGSVVATPATSPLVS